MTIHIQSNSKEQTRSDFVPAVTPHLAGLNCIPLIQDPKTTEKLSARDWNVLPSFEEEPVVQVFHHIHGSSEDSLYEQNTRTLLNSSKNINESTKNTANREV